MICTHIFTCMHKHALSAKKKKNVYTCTKMLKEIYLQFSHTAHVCISTHYILEGVPFQDDKESLFRLQQ